MIFAFVVVVVTNRLEVPAEVSKKCLSCEHSKRIESENAYGVGETRGTHRKMPRHSLIG
jgi:hypothetical protein